MDKVNLTERFTRVSEHWRPKIIGQVNDHQVKIAKVEGAFEWHHHDDSDELFLVHRGRLRIELRDADDVTLDAGELFVVPRGVEHRPVAEDEVELVMFEAEGTLNTGNVRSERTAEAERI